MAILWVRVLSGAVCSALTSPGADVGAVSPVLVQLWEDAGGHSMASLASVEILSGTTRAIVIADAPMSQAVRRLASYSQGHPSGC